jgi:hypothetical protein
MKFIKVNIAFAFIILFFAPQIKAQLSGSYNVGTGQTYTSLTRAGGFFAAVNSQGLSGNVTAYITSNITNENGANDLYQWTEYGAGGYTITIRPNAATTRQIYGSVNDAMIKLSGADRVTFDGRYSGSGMYLTFRNTNTNYPTFSFINDAQNNTITYCTVESGNSNTSSTTSIGAILFGTTTGTQGNDNNTISYCSIRDRTDATGYPAYSIFSYGTTSTTARYNSGNQILNNNIFNFWINGGYCGAVYLSDGSGDNWVISGNSFYQTSSRTSTSNTTGGWNIIFLNYTGINNCTVTNNYIGGSAPNCGGTPWTASTSAFGALQFPGIRAIVGSNTASSIQGNTIANIDFSTRTSSGSYPFVGILVQSGEVNVGNVTGNTIGSSTGTGSISISFSNTGYYTVYSRGIDHRSDGNVNNNVIGSITISSSTNNTVIFDCLIYSSTPSSGVSISNNTIGSSTSANSIQHTSTSYTVYLRGIYTTIDGVAITLSNNTIANLTNNSTGSSSVNYAMINTGDGAATITGNSIHDLNSPHTNSSYIGTLGIGNTSTASSQLIEENTIYALNNTTTAGVNTSVVGLSLEGSTGSGTIARNRIYGLTNSSTGSAPFIFGINAYWGSWTASNNQIALTNGEATDNSNNIFPPANENNIPHNSNTIFNTKRAENNNNSLQLSGEQIPEENEIQVKSLKNPEPITDATNSVFIAGIYDISGNTWNYYYNTIYIGGSISSGNENSYCYVRRSYTTTVTFRNNLFFNARTGGTGYHYAIANEIGGSTGWSSTASNYNSFVSSNANTIGAWGSGVNRTIDQWRTSSGGDSHSWGTTSAVISGTNLFSSISSGNLNINSGNSAAWLVSGKGIAVSGQSTDYEGTARATTISGGTTDIGSDEFAAAPPSNPLATIDNAPGSGVTSNFTLYGRRIITINWGTGGTSYPSSMNVRFYSGVNPLNTLGGNYSNSYWQINIGSGSFSGTTYSVTIYFGDNETYTITSPNINTLLAKSNGTWEVFPAGAGSWQTQLSWANLTVRTTGLNGFSDFALTDATAPLPVILTYFGAVVNERNVNLKWITEIEINNKGFDVERRDITKENNTEWEKIAFVNGNGNTNQPTTYELSDTRLSTGKYQYRLKQIDYNGNSEYFVLTNPSEVIIGAPERIILSQNYPNPSNPKSLIDYQLSFTGKVILKVYDITGREAATLVDDVKEAGYYTAEFDGSKLASGVYIYRLIIEGNGQQYVKSLKMALIK